MDKRRTKLSKILLQFEQITDERLAVVENADTIFKQVFSTVTHVKRYHDSLKPKEISDVYTYCLDILKFFTEVNSRFENLIDELPLKTMNWDEQKFVPSNVEEQSNLSLIPSAVEEIPFTNVEETSPNSQSGLNISNREITVFEQCGFQNTSLSSILPDSTDIADGEFDLQSIKRNLREVSEKFGFNKKNFSDMKDYYQKSSTNLNHCSSVLPESFLSSDSSDLDVSNKRTFEIPEKDTNNSQASSTRQSMSPYSSTSCCSEETVKDSSVKSASPLISFSEESTDTDQDCCVVVVPTVNKLPSNLIINGNASTTNKCSALEKLNNYRSHNVETTEKFEDLVSPDISLRPSGTIIKNFIPPVADKKSKKKKDKKSKNKEKIHYELKYKETPKEGQECIMSHIESPSEFYIHIVDGATELIDDFNDQINEYYMKQSKNYKYESKEEALNDIGRFCIVYIEKEKMWYRGEIEDEYRDSKHDDVLVRLVDYGSKKLVSYKHLRMLTDTMTQLPMLAIRCHFPLLYPPDSTNVNRLTQWPAKSIEALLNISGIFGCDNKMQFFKIVYAHKEQNSLAIDLHHIEAGSEENTLGQVLLDTGLAVQIDDTYDENQADLEDFLQDLDDLEQDNINEAVMGYDPRDEARICRFTKKDGTCFKGRHCKLEHAPLSKDGFTTDQEQVFTEAMYTLVLPPVGTEVKLLITGYTDTCRFFAQIVTVVHQADKKYFMDQAFYLLSKDMNSERTVKTYEPFKISPSMGEIVCVEHWKKWSRGIVREIFTDTNKPEVQVFLVDFGEYKKVAVKEIRKIKPNFLQLPFQAVECYIHNFEVNKKCSPKAARKFFFNNLYFKNFSATTLSSYPPLKLKLTNINGLIDVGETLAANGFAVPRIHDMNVDDNSFLNLH